MTRDFFTTLVELKEHGIDYTNSSLVIDTAKHELLGIPYSIHDMEYTENQNNGRPSLVLGDWSKYCVKRPKGVGLSIEKKEGIISLTVVFSARGHVEDRNSFAVLDSFSG